jgi:hypothetical protein
MSWEDKTQFSPTKGTLPSRGILITRRRIEMKRRFLNFAAILSSSLLLICGCATKYKPEGFSGGYHEVRIDQNTVDVSFQGNGYTSADRAQQYCLYRCAELTKSYGYDYFTFIREDVDIKQQQMHSPGTYSTNTYGGQTYGTYTPGVTYNIRKPTAHARIKMFKGSKPENDPNAFVAEEVIKYLGPQLEIKRNLGE